MARWTSGYVARFSIWNQVFDSPTSLILYGGIMVKKVKPIVLPETVENLKEVPEVVSPDSAGQITHEVEGHSQFIHPTINQELAKLREQEIQREANHRRLAKDVKKTR